MKKLVIFLCSDAYMVSFHRTSHINLIIQVLIYTLCYDLCTIYLILIFSTHKYAVRHSCCDQVTLLLK